MTSPPLVFKLVDQLRPRLLLALAVEEVLDRPAQLLERAALRAILVLLVELRDLGVGDRLRPLRGVLRHERVDRLARGLGGVLDQDVADQLLEHVAAVLIEQLRDARALGGVELFPLRVELFERDLAAADFGDHLVGIRRRRGQPARRHSASSAHAASPAAHRRETRRRARDRLNLIQSAYHRVSALVSARRRSRLAS